MTTKNTRHEIGIASCLQCLNFAWQTSQIVSIKIRVCRANNIANIDEVLFKLDKQKSGKLLLLVNLCLNCKRWTLLSNSKFAGASTLITIRNMSKISLSSFDGKTEIRIAGHACWHCQISSKIHHIYLLIWDCIIRIF